jgi:hypothetical protein
MTTKSVTHTAPLKNRRALDSMIVSRGQVLKGGRKARPYKKARTPWVGAGFIPARYSRGVRDTRRKNRTVLYETRPRSVRAHGL